VSYGQLRMIGCIAGVVVSSKWDIDWVVAHFYRRWYLWSFAVQYSYLVFFVFWCCVRLFCA